MTIPVPVPVSQFPDAGALAGTEIVPVVKNGITSQTTSQEIADLGSGAVTSVNGQTGVVVLNAASVGALPVGTTLVTSVNGQSGVAVLDAADVGAVALTDLPLVIGSGGTGQTTANTALNALLPNQTGQVTKVLTTDGTNTSWEAAGGGGSAETFVARIFRLSSAAFNNASFTNWDAADVIQTSPDAHWDDVGQHLVFDTTGVYRVSVQCVGDANVGWPEDLALYGTRFNGVGVAQYARYQKTAEGANFMSDTQVWTTEAFFQATALDTLVIALYAASYASIGVSINFSMNILVQRISP